MPTLTCTPTPKKQPLFQQIASSENNQPEKPQNIITQSQSDSETKINDYPVADTTSELETTPNSPQPTQPLIGIIDTGFAADNPNIDYSQIILGKDLIDNDNNPLLQPNEGNQHGSTILEIIAGDKNQNNSQTPIWLGRATGSGNWHESLIEFVDAAKASKQPNAVVNLSFDLTEVSPDGRETTRYQLTETEKSALKYAQDNNILIVAAAGNQGAKSSALGQASTEFPNIITVGAAQNNNRTAYSSYGQGLDILVEDTIPETTTPPKTGTSIAAAKVTATVSQMWAANPQLSSQQIKNILLKTATDIDIPGWDEKTGYGILDKDKAIQTAAQTIPTIAVLVAAKPQIPKSILSPETKSNSQTNNTPAKPSSRPALTNAQANTPKTTSTSTGDNNQGTSSSTTELAPNTTTNTSKSGSTTTTDTQTNQSFSNTKSNWNKSRVNENTKSNNSSTWTRNSTTSAPSYSSRDYTEEYRENDSQGQKDYSRVQYDENYSGQNSSKYKYKNSSNYTSPSQTTNSSSENYRNSQSKSTSKSGTNTSIANGNRQDDWGAKSSSNSRYTSGNYVSSSNSNSQNAGKENWTNSSNGNNYTNTNNGKQTTVNKSDSTSSDNSGPSKSSSSSDNYSVINSTWDNSTTNGKTVGSNTTENYSENSNNNHSSYNDGKSNNTSNRDNYTVNQSQQTNSSNGTSYWQNNRNNNYSVSQGNDTQSYKSGPETSSSNTDSYSVTKSDATSSNSNGKPSSKNNSETYSENTVQRNNEYKVDAYTSTGSSDEQTITASRSNSSNDGSNSNWFSGSNTSRTSNSQTVTNYKDGRKEENNNSSYEKWSSERTDDSKGLVSSVSKYSRWSSSYSKSSFKGGYSWTETVSGYDSESGTKGKTSSSSSSSWTWTRSGTVWDDGRNSWSESWSKSSWNNDKYTSESDSKNGSFDPKKTGPQTNNLPKIGEAPRLNKVPKPEVPIDLTKPPKPSKDISTPPRRTPPQVIENAPDNWFAGPGGNPSSGQWPPQDIGSYWLSYTGTFKNTTPEQRRQIFRDIINNPSIKKVYMNVLSAFGVTFLPTNKNVNMIGDLKGNDVFKEFKEELDKYNSSKPLNQQRKIDVVGWFEATGMSLPGSTLYNAAANSRYQNAGNEPIPNTSAVLNTITDGVPTLDILDPNVHNTLKEIVNDFLKIHPFVNEIIFDDRYGILEQAEPEIVRRYAAKIPLSYKTSADNKRWIMEQITKNLEDIKKSLPNGKKLSISGQNFYSAAKTNNQDLSSWLKKGLIDGELNFQLYLPGNEYDRFVQEYNQYIKNFNAVFSQAGAPASRPSISVSLASKTKGQSLTRDDIVKQARFLRNILPDKTPENQRPKLPINPTQILGFDYGLFKKINQ